jgi:hypothetical protein
VVTNISEVSMASIFRVKMEVIPHPEDGGNTFLQNIGTTYKTT